MAKRIVKDNVKPKVRPALTPEARENQMIALAMDLAEERLRDGSASSQEVVHFLKLGTAKEKLEREKIEKEISLLSEKKKALESAERSEELFSNAIEAMKMYTGSNTGDDYHG